MEIFDQTGHKWDLVKENNDFFWPDHLDLGFGQKNQWKTLIKSYKFKI